MLTYSAESGGDKKRVGSGRAASHTTARHANAIANTTPSTRRSDTNNSETKSLERAVAHARGDHPPALFQGPAHDECHAAIEVIAEMQRNRAQREAEPSSAEEKE